MASSTLNTFYLPELASVDSLLIDQETYKWCSSVQKEFIIRTIDMKGMYTVSVRQRLCWLFQCCRKLDVSISDHFGNEVVRMKSRFTSCRKSIDIYTPPEHLLGKVKEEFNMFRTKLTIIDTNGEVLLRVRGPASISTYFLPVIEYQVFSAEGEVVGKITKVWPGYIRERILNLHMYSVIFPDSSEVDLKVLLMAACFLIDFINFGS